MQLTNNGSLESQHTYYDICPWSYDGRYIVFSSAPADADWTPFGHDTLACRDGRVNVIDVETMAIQEVAVGAVYLRHGGAFCMWHPKGHRITYRRDIDHFASLDLETGEEQVLPAIVRQLSPDGTHFATLLRSPHGGGQGEGVGLIAADGSGARELVTREQLYELTPNRGEFAPEDMLLGNTKWRPDAANPWVRHILVAMWVYSHPEVRRSLYIISSDGTEARWLTYFAHHHSWALNGASVLLNDVLQPPDVRAGHPRMFLIDVDGTNRRVVFDQPVGSHPLMHPDGTSILDADHRGITLAQLRTRRLERLVDFSRPFEGSHHGTHPHPVWNQDGSQLLYNSAESGHSEIYLISMEG